MVVAADHVAGVEQRLEDRDAESAGEMVVARAGQAQRLGARALPQRSDRRGRRHLRERLEQLAAVRAGQPVVPVAALGQHLEQPGVREPGEMAGRRRRGDPRLARQHARGKGAPVAEREQDPRAGRLGEERAQRREVGVSGMGGMGHPSTVAPGRHARPAVLRRLERAAAPSVGRRRARAGGAAARPALDPERRRGAGGVRHRPGPPRAAARAGRQSRMTGKRTTSLIVVLPVMSITRRSMPMPIPPVGGMPCSSART